MRIPRRSAAPAISLLLCVKDGMPHLVDALESVRAQTFGDFELVIQDGASSDGSAELLRRFDGAPSASFVSEADRGVGDAFNRALRRCRGEIVGSIDADNLLAPDALETVAAAFAARAHGALYGSVELVDADGAPLRRFVPSEFELLRVICCEVVPPFSTSFFSRARCGHELRFDPNLRTCADYDLWLRLGGLPIGRLDAVLGRTRLSGQSMSRDAGRYDQFVVDKQRALRRYLARQQPTPLVESIRRRGEAGIWLWAAESAWELEGPSDRVRGYAARAEDIDSASPRLVALAERLDASAPSASEEPPAAAGHAVDPPGLFGALRRRRH